MAAVLITLARTGVLFGADQALLADAVAARTGGLNSAAVTLTTIGNTGAMSVLAIVVGIGFWLRRRVAEGVYVIASMATASLVFTVLKRILDRPRPPERFMVVRETNESLPSGHATMSAAVIGSLVLLAWPHLAAAGRAVAVAAGVLWVGAVGATRIYLGVHWFSDVLSGWALGLAWTVECAALLIAWRARPAAVM